MTFLKRFLYHITGVCFKLLLLLLPLIFTTVLLLSNPKYVNQALKESGVYDHFVSQVITDSQQQTTDTNTKQMLADPAIQSAAQKSFTPQLLQSSAENITAGVFAWMHGQTAEPQFRVDFTNAKAELNNSIASYIEKRAKTLPPCTLQQLRQLNSNVDLLQLPCVPPGFNIQAAAQQYSESFWNNGNFLKDPVITQQTIAAQNGGKVVPDQLRNVPRIYKALTTAMWVLAGLTVLLAMLLVFVRKNRRAGLTHVAWALIGVGTFIVIDLIVYWFLFAHTNARSAVGELTQAMWAQGIQSLVREGNKIILAWSIGYVVIGAGLLGLARLQFPGQSSAPTLEPNTASAPEDTPENTVKK